MLRVSLVALEGALEGDREQDLISPDARQGSLAHRLIKYRRLLAQ